MKIIITLILSANLFSQVLEKQNKLLWDGTDWNNIEKRAIGGTKSIYQIKSAYISGLLDGRLYYYLKSWAEDRKFADIGFIMEKQINKISNWADLVSIHPIAGEDSVKQIKDV